MMTTLIVCAASSILVMMVVFPAKASGGHYANDNPNNDYPENYNQDDRYNTNHRNHYPEQRETTAIWCFQCNSMYDQGCENIAPNDTSSEYYKQCKDDEQTEKTRNGREFFCRKIVQTIWDREGLKRVVRKCGFVPHLKLPCYSYDSEGHDDVVCQCFSDACNEAPRMTPLLLTWMSGIAAVITTSLFR
ncbi:hypothetical protein GE061_011811 [Apolygus lucorum]|uniref:Uncharacterized protein n=1 Tax=Apolygus lucorum TaxID=248454 RepID=A0A6A4K732_APOLU|nr:hypothetical protein GE061_011811 [Apolygus lucorum]